MATKNETLAAGVAGKGCLGKAAPDEPIFILRANDLLASGIVREWADRLETRSAALAELTGERKEKIAEARRVALEMDRWRAEVGHGGKLPD